MSVRAVCAPRRLHRTHVHSCAAVADEVPLTRRGIPHVRHWLDPSLGGEPLSAQLERLPCDADLAQCERHQFVGISSGVHAQALQFVFGLTEQHFADRCIASLDYFQLEHAGSLLRTQTLQPERSPGEDLVERSVERGALARPARRGKGKRPRPSRLRLHSPPRLRAAPFSGIKPREAETGR